MNLERVGKAIRDRGLKYGFLANQLGIAKTTFSAKLKGRSQFSVDELRTLAKILQVSVDYLVDD